MVDPVISAPAGAPLGGRFRPKGLEGHPVFPLFVMFLVVAVQQIDNQAYAVLLPNIRDEFHLSTAGALGLLAIASPVSLGMGLLIGWAGDRLRRTPLVAGGAAVSAGSLLVTSFAPSIGVLAVGRAGAALGQVVDQPLHQSLIADYYPQNIRPTVFGFYNAGLPVGRLIGPLLAGWLAASYSWRTPFLVQAVLMVFAFLLTLTLREPNRGRLDRLAAGADETILDVEARPPTFGQSWRLLYTVASIRRIYFAFPLIVGSFQGLQALLSLYYERIHGIDETGRGFLFAMNEPFALLGLFLLTPVLRRRMDNDPARGLSILRYVSFGVAGSVAVIAIAPNIQVAIAANIGRSAFNAVLAPALFATMSLVMPPRARSMGFAVLTLWALPAIAFLPVIGGIADVFGLRVGILLMAPVILVGSWLLASAGRTVNVDMENNRRYTLLESAAQAERIRFRAALESGELTEKDFALLDVQDIHVSYGSVKVLFGVDLKVNKGDRVALLGTNGAGKSTLLKVISGLLTPDVGTGGTVWYKNEDITFLLPSQRVRLGMIQIGGGRATFPTLSVEENLKMGAYPFLGDEGLVADRVEDVFQKFPVLRQRRTQRAGTLSGGEQQMAALGRALIAGPELLMIDELALGLAPVVMGEILAMVDAIVEQGTTLIVVEQSLNVALSIADHAYFMEKGEIRFSGPTEDLLARDDIVRSIFFGATSGAGS